MSAPRLTSLALLLVLIGVGVLHGQNDFFIDIDSTQGGTPLTTEPGYTSLNVGGGSTGNVTVGGTTFTVFSADGSRNRTAGPSVLTNDFVFDDGAGEAVGVQVNSLPSGIYRANVYAYDHTSAAGNQIVGIQSGVSGGTLFTDSFASNPSTPFSFVFATSDLYGGGLPDGGGIFTRENNGANRSRFNALELTQLDLVPSSTQFKIDINSANTTGSNSGGPLVTESGWVGLDATQPSEGDSVTVDGTTFQVFSSAGSRVRVSGGNPNPNDLTGDFVFDNVGSNEAVGLQVFDLPDGVWEASVWSWDEDFPTQDQIVGITAFAAGETIFTESFAPDPDDPFTFIFDSSILPDGFGIFTRAGGAASNSARFNALQLTQLGPAAVPEPASVAIWSLIGLGLAGFGYTRIRRKK